MNGINLDFKSNLGKLSSSLKSATSAFGKLGKAVKSNNSGLAKAQSAIKKTNASFNNITRDSNRATSGINKLNRGFLNMGSAIRMIGIYQLARGLSTAISSAMDMIETANLFSVAMGTLATETNKVVVGWATLTGLDTTNIQTSVGTFGALSKSMGMTDKASQQLSTTTYRLGLDLASLYNVGIEQALGDLRSGLVGQSETMYKYGVDVTEASLKVEAMNQGITKSVRNMSQGEKMALRYAVMLRQTGVAQGDFARTIEQPANQMRILKERIVTLSRTIGTIFIPILASILPYLNAIVQVITVLMARLASLFGYTEDMANIFNFEKVGGTTVTDDLEEGLGSASDSAKDLKGQLMGFDEINLWTPPTEDASSGSSATGAIAGGVDMSWMDDLTYDSGFDKIKTKSQAMADAMVANWDRIMVATDRLKESIIGLWDGGLRILGRATFKGLDGLYQNFLKPVGSWVLGKGLPDLVDIFNKGLLKINYRNLIVSMNNLWTALTPFAIGIGKGLLSFFENVLVPIGVWGANSFLPAFFDTLTVALEEMGLTIQSNSDSFSFLWDGILKPLGQWAGKHIVSQLEDLQVILKKLGDWARSNKGDFEKILYVLGGVILTGGGLVLLAFAFDKLKKATEGIHLVFTLLTSPLGLIALAIGGLIGLGVLLYKNWDEVKAMGGGLIEDTLLPMVDFLVGKFKDAWDAIIKVVKWFTENIISPLIDMLKILWENVLLPLALFIVDNLAISFGVWMDVLKSLWDNVLLPLADFIVSVFTEALNGLRDIMVGLEPVINVIRDVFMFLWKNVLEPLMQFLADAFVTNVDGVFKHIGNVIETLKEVFKGLINFIAGVFTGDWSRAFKGLGNVIVGILNGIISGFETSFNWIIKKINELAIFANKVLANLGMEFRFSTMGEIKFGRLDYLKYDSVASKPMMQYAGGGTPDYGEMFIAREAGAELVGNIGGKAGVMNNDQIVEAVSAGVYSAVTSAMKVSGGNGNQEKEVILEIDGTKLGRILLPKMNGESTRLGYKPILTTR